MRILKKISLFTSLILFVSLIFWGGKSVFAAEKPSIDDLFISESSYEDTMKNVVEPYIDNDKETGYMDVGENDFKIYYEKYLIPNSRASVVISHGFTESLEKYNEMIYYFMKEGYSVYGIEHRGHGRSGHLGTVDETQVSVDKFDDYLSDLKQFLDEIVKPETGGQKLFLYSHSMGGAIGARFLEKYKGYFDAAILSSPMIEMNTGNIPGPIAALVADGSILISKGDEYVQGQGKYNTEYNFEGAATNCEARYSYYYNIEKENPELQRGGASYKWLKANLDATALIMLPTNAAKVKIPVLLFQAQNDDYVKPEGQCIFKNCAKNCTLVKVSGAKHEIYLEKDSILKLYLEKVMDFYSKNI